MTDTLNLQIPSPTFGGSTGGWLRAAETEEMLVLKKRVAKMLPVKNLFFSILV